VKSVAAEGMMVGGKHGAGLKGGVEKRGSGEGEGQRQEVQLNPTMTCHSLFLVPAGFKWHMHTMAVVLKMSTHVFMGRFDERVRG
jgi:hypothetical protein